MNGFFASVLFVGGYSIGWVFQESQRTTALDRCDTEVLQLTVQLNDDRAAYFREIAECQTP